MSTPAPRALERRGLLLAFVVFGGFWGAWAAVLPDVRERAGLGDGGLGLVLGAVAVAALPAMPLAGRLVDVHGARTLLPRLLGAFAVAAALLGLAAAPLPLVLALVLLGAATGALDVVLTATTAAWERVEGDRLMAAGHGCFSVGVLVGAVSTGLARDAGSGPAPVLAATGLAVALVALLQPAYRTVVRPDGDAPGRRRLAPLLVGLGALAASAFLVEDAVSTWSALHLERDLAAPPWVGGLGPGLFAGAMAVGRFGAHALARPGSEARVLGAGGSVLAAGLVLLALAPTPALALAGTAVAGAGVSVIAPTLFSAVGARSAPGRAGTDLALVTAFGYVGFVTGPVVVGLLSEALTLPRAIAALSVLGLAIAVAGPLLLRRPRQASLVPTGAARDSATDPDVRRSDADGRAVQQGGQVRLVPAGPAGDRQGPHRGQRPEEPGEDQRDGGQGAAQGRSAPAHAVAPPVRPCRPAPAPGAGGAA